MQVPVDSIKVKLRVRKDMGDLAALKDSMAKYGQISPIVVTRMHELVAGHRRLTVARQLGWHSVEISYVDQASEEAKLEIELQENVHRKDFSPEELLDGYRRLDRLRHPGPVRRFGQFFRRLFNRIFRRGPRPEPTPAPAPPLDDLDPQDYGI